jgi:hypothetical protein
MFDDLRVPETMQVRADIEEPELQAIAPTVTVISDVDGLMHVLDEMDQEFQRLLLLGSAGTGISQHPHEVFDLAHHTPTARTVLPVVARFRDRHIHIVPRRGSRISLLICPRGNVNQTLPVEEIPYVLWNIVGQAFSLSGTFPADC